MADEIQKSIDRTQDDGATLISQEEVKTASSALSKLSRELPDTALKNAYVGKLLLNRIDEYEKEVASLRAYQAKFHEADKRAATLNERLEMTEGSIGVRSALSALGGVTTGSLFSLWSYPQIFWGMLFLSFILFFIAYIAPSLIRLIKSKMP